MIRILIAHGNLDVIEEIAECVRSALPRRTDVVRCRNAAAIRAAIRGDSTELLISYVDLAPDASSVPVAGLGVSLLHQLRDEKSDICTIIVAPHTTHDFSVELDKIERTALVLEGSRFEDEMERKLRWASELIEPDTLASDRSHRRQPSRQAKDTVRFVIEILLRRNGQCNYESVSSGGRIVFSQKFPFTVSEKDMQDLIARSKQAASSKEWMNDFTEVGRKLRDILMKGDPRIIQDVGFVRGVLAARDEPGSLPAIRFLVEKDMHFIAVEALLDDNDKYWLERAPVSRQLALNSQYSQIPLFRDAGTRKGPINCLIVDANLTAPVVVKQHRFLPLPGVAQEVSDLAKHLHGQKDVRIGQIGCIWRDKADGSIKISMQKGNGEPEVQQHGTSFTKVLGDTLLGRSVWHVVHFAGHTYYDAGEDHGYLVLPGLAPASLSDGSGEIVGTPLLARWLGRTRFVYMSNCHGSSADFVFQFCTSGVPAMTGFRAEVDDAKATQHARLFYEHLVAQRSLEDAFVEAWRGMYQEHRKDRVWASSELIVQLAA